MVTDRPEPKAVKVAQLSGPSQTLLVATYHSVGVSAWLVRTILPSAKRWLEKKS